MLTLTAGLQTGLSSLQSLRTAVSIVSQNIANVNTPGYARRRAAIETLRAGADLLWNDLGVQVGEVRSLRDELVQRRIQAETHAKHFFDESAVAFRQVEEILYGGGENVSASLTRFFNSFSELASDPASPALRATVLSRGRQLGETFAATAAKLDAVRIEMVRDARQTVDDINRISSEIAALNQQLAPLSSNGQDGGALEDQRHRLLEQLAEKIDFSAYQDELGQWNVTTRSGVQLIQGSESQPLSLSESGAGITIQSGSNDVSDQFETGVLGAQIAFVNQTAADFAGRLDLMAGELAEQVNSIHRAGQGLDGTSGLDFFGFDPGSPATSLVVQITDPRELAAAVLGSGPGDGSNAQQIADLGQTEIMALSGTASEFYARFVAEVGLEARFVEQSNQLQNDILLQLQNERDSVSGVSLDEEMVSLMQLQRNYQASSQLIRVIDGLMEETMRLIR